MASNNPAQVAPSNTPLLRPRSELTEPPAISPEILHQLCQIVEDIEAATSYMPLARAALQSNDIHRGPELQRVALWMVDNTTERLDSVQQALAAISEILDCDPQLATVSRMLCPTCVCWRRNYKTMQLVKHAVRRPAL